MSRPPLDELYLQWLYSQVGSVKNRNPSRSYWKILRKLFTKEFVWIVPNDDNRAEDGRDLRLEFLEEYDVRDADATWMRLGCSMLELLIGLSRRLSFEAEGEPSSWFWKLMENLDLERYNDNTPFSDAAIDELLDRVIWRTYRRNGAGGLFPLKRTREDQRQVEIWYQLCAYLLED
jgi:hypothetical protein